MMSKAAVHAGGSVKENAAYEEVRNRIVPILINYEGNKDYLTDKPFRKMQDLAVVYQLFEENGESIRLKPVTREMFRAYDVRLDTLHDNAVQVMRTVMPSGMRFLEELVIEGKADKKMKMQTVEAFLEKQESTGSPVCGAIVVSNSILCHGAGAILDPEVTAALAKVAGRDYLIIPSSIHELIVIPRQMAESLGSMRPMVRRVNRSMADESEILSDHIYTYDYVQQQLKIRQ
ncbi:MAG: hypothetical protein IJU30_02080 [Lachnospiraceae bacterium]|nr:hypothetical protein [Lachnospiraceae bacterium]